MGRLAYTDFDEFADSICGVAGRFVPTARSAAEWWIQVVRVKRLELQQLQIGGAAAFAGDGAPGTLTFGVPMTHPGAIHIDGHSLTSDSFILLRRDQPFTYSARNVVRWAGVTVPLDHGRMDDDLRDAAEEGAFTQGDVRVHTVQRLLDQLRSLIARMCVDDRSVSLVDRAAVAAAEEEVMSATFRLLEAGACSRGRQVGRPQVPRSRVIRQCLDLINASEGQPLFMEDLCQATQVSERTLRNIFREYFGVGPIRLLKVRQLREIRGALLAADASEQTVTQIATRFGVWDFSLFARNYRALYGEAPSITLRNKAPHYQPDVERHTYEGEFSPTWISYASRRFGHTDGPGADASI